MKIVLKILFTLESKVVTFFKIFILKSCGHAQDNTVSTHIFKFDIFEYFVMFRSVFPVLKIQYHK